MVSKPNPIQSNANPSKKSNPIFITQQNLHAIQMAFLNKIFIWIGIQPNVAELLLYQCNPWISFNPHPLLKTLVL